MSPLDRQEFERMKQEIADLKREVEMSKQQQIQIPLDDASVQVLIQALYNKRIDRLTVKDLRYVSLTAVS